MHRHFILGGMAALLGTVLMWTAQAKDIPRLGSIYYGQLVNAFGYPATAGDAVTLIATTPEAVEAGRYDLGPVIGPGINYRLDVNVVDSGSGSDGTSVPDGGSIRIQALAGGGPVPLIGETNAVVQSGAVRRSDLILGSDTNDNGIPDEWELFVIDALAALGIDVGVTNLADFDPSADYDGDGVSNRDEFFSGSLPFLDGDYLRIEEFRTEADGSHRIRFLGNAGFRYQVHTTGDPLTGSWQISTFSTHNATVGEASLVVGEGTMQDLYFPTNGLNQFFRLMVE